MGSSDGPSDESSDESSAGSSDGTSDASKTCIREHYRYTLDLFAICTVNVCRGTY